jgi:CDP-diacylglycerol pyrophosphatase
MNPLNLRLIRPLLLLLAALCILSGTAPAYAAGSRDILWNILNTCLDPTVPNYCSSCRSPVLDAPCALGKTCKETTEVWVLTPEYVALRDRKMCDCPGEFVHGLVMPLKKVTGVEDPRKPDGIWNFAWAIACSRLEDEMERALAVNPPGNRDQDQLHVHVVRLQKDARKRFDPERLCRIADLDQVWSTADRLAKANGLADYGVLVAAHPEGGYLVLVDRASTEKSYTVPRCR